MDYYIESEKGRVLFTPSYYNKIGEGIEGKTYKNDDLAIKILYDYCDSPCLNEYNNKRIGNLTEQECKYLINISESMQQILLPLSIVRDNDGIYKGYTTRRIDKPKHGRNILNMPKIKVINNLKIINEDVLLLGEHKVELHDIGTHNSLIKNNKLYFIDPGFYKTSKDRTKEEVHKNNEYMMTGYIKDLITYIYESCAYENNPEKRKKIRQLEAILKEEYFLTNPITFLEKELKYNESIKHLAKRFCR